MSGYFNNSCADVSKIFTCKFPDSKIAKSFELSRTKLKYGINFRIALYFRDILYNHLQKSDCFVISFDKSLNDYAQKFQMDILIRHFDYIENRVKVCYLDSKCFGDATHQDLFIQFMQVLFKLDTNKSFQVSMDGPIVNLKFLKNLQQDCLENEQHELINIRNCGLHIIHGAFNTGAESRSCNIRETLHGSYQVLYMIHLPVEVTSKPS